jgi:predicted DNA-binding transcriptional regulator AlpA
MDEADRLVLRPELERMVGMSYPTIWRRMRDGTFPRSVVIGKGQQAKVAWKLSEIQGWMDRLPRQRLLGDDGEMRRTR